MSHLDAILLGIIQGITEWLPLSSEAQTMLVATKVMGISPVNALSYAIFLHLGTMCAVLIKFRSEFVGMLTNLTSPLTTTVIIATICTGISGVPLYYLMKGSLSTGVNVTLLIGILLIVTGILLRYNTAGLKERDDLSTMDTVLLGLFQGAAILPGVSRSGVTTTYLLMKKVKQEAALTLSFIISVPAVIGAVIIDSGSTPINLPLASAMFFPSLIVGYLMIEGLITFARKVNFSWFCIVLGLVAISVTLWGI